MVLLQFNVITILLIIIFLAPILSGLFMPFSRERIQYSLGSLLGSIEFIFGFLLSIYLTKRIFFENDTGVYKEIYRRIPQIVKDNLYGKDILTYIIVAPIILAFILMALRLFTTPFYRKVIIPLSDRLYIRVSYANRAIKSILSALWQVPKSVYAVLICVVLLNFSSYYFIHPSLAKWMNESIVYQTLYKNAVYPVLNSNIAKQIPVIVNDSFRRTTQRISPEESETGRLSIAEQIAKRISNGNIGVIEYFNGVTLDEAIKSNDEIDETARKIVGNEQNSKKKAYLIYKWISRNISYDYDKAQKVSVDSRGISSGSIAAFDTRKGICFDYSSLYVSMGRAVGLKVRLVTGLGYSGANWGDHAWNQVYFQEEQRWINVDATFGTSANYFDKPDFKVDHKYDDIQGEW